MAAFLVPLCLLACKREGAKPIPAGEQTVKPKASFPYATAHSGGSFDKKGRELWVARDGVRLAPTDTALVPIVDGSIPVEHKRSGPHDLHVVTLAKALGAQEPNREAVLHVDSKVTYRVLTEVLFTLGQVGFTRWQFVVKTDSGALASIVLEAPSIGKGAPSSSAATIAAELDALEMKALATLGSSLPPGILGSVPPPPPPPKCGDLPLQLHAIVTTEGFIVKAFGASIGADCRTPGVGTTVVMKDGRYDFAALHGCVTKLVSCSKAYASEHAAMVGASPTTEFQTVVSVWDAVRRRDDGTPLLPDLSLTVVR